MIACADDTVPFTIISAGALAGSGSETASGFSETDSAAGAAGFAMSNVFPSLSNESAGASQSTSASKTTGMLSNVLFRSVVTRTTTGSETSPPFPALSVMIPVSASNSAEARDVFGTSATDFIFPADEESRTTSRQGSE